MNIELAERVWKQINATPELYRQESFAVQTDCGTAYCFAGWALHFSGYVPRFYKPPLSHMRDTYQFTDPEGNRVYALDAGQKTLELEESWARRLFDHYNSQDDVKQILLRIAEEHGQTINLD